MVKISWSGVLKKKEICFISPMFFNCIGGMETHAYEFIKVFAGDKEFPIKSILVKKFDRDGIPVPNYEDRDDPGEANSVSKKIKKLTQRALTGDFKEDAKKIMDTRDIENTVFFLNSPTWLPSFEIIKKKYPETKLILRSGGNDIVAGWIANETNDRKSLEESRSRVVEIINQYVDYCIVNSEYSAGRTKSAGVNENKIVKVIGGVDCSAFQPSKSAARLRITILTTARLVKFKGFEYSIKAVKEVIKKRDLDVHYMIVGDGPERSTIERLSGGGLENRLSILGAQRIEDMPEYYSKADIFLHLPIYLERHERGSSYIHTETMGRCLCEASSSGLPIVSARVGGVPEIVDDNDTGYLVPEKDYISASKKLLELILNFDKRIEMGNKGRKKAGRYFDWKVVFEQYRKMFV